MQSLPYGSWPSPVDAALAATHDGRPEYAGFVGDEVWWTAPRPAEGGRRAGGPHAYLAFEGFEGEGHAFRRADTMVRALEAELSLYAQVFGLDPAGIPTLELGT
jgi:hypothetical protein